MPSTTDAQKLRPPTLFCAPIHDCQQLLDPYQYQIQCSALPRSDVTEPRAYESAGSRGRPCVVPRGPSPSRGCTKPAPSCSISLNIMYHERNTKLLYSTTMYRYDPKFCQASTDLFLHYLDSCLFMNSSACTLVVERLSTSSSSSLQLFSTLQVPSFSPALDDISVCSL